MALEFDEEKHLYTLDGVELPSVTEICRFLNYDTAVNAKPWLRDAAAARGTRVHEWCMLYDYDALDFSDIEPCEMGYVQAYLSFLRDYRPQWQFIEHSIGSDRLGYAGTLDRYGLIDGKTAIVDLKTTSVLRKVPLAAQLAGYGDLLFDRYGYETNNFYGLHLQKDGCYALAEVEPDFETFYNCMALHNKLKRKKRVKHEQ